MAQGAPVSVPAHPLGIKPAGNAYGAEQNIKAAAGWFTSISDELIIHVLEYLDCLSLLRFGSTCKALYAFSRFEDLWKTLFVESPPSKVTWNRSWFSTYWCLPKELRSRVSCQNLFSDVLYRPFLCAQMPLKPYATNIPDQNNIPRLRTLSTECFTTHWANKPFILTDVVHEWPAFHEWSIPFLLQQFCGVEFRAEAVDWPLDTCIDYMNSNEDESPLYLFDKSFVEKMGLREGKGQDGHYWVPECFAEDLFAVLGEQRPDSRWLIMGPERSGSTFHKDPNATSAWNAVLRGSKYWIMFPSSTSYPAPPGVFVSENQSEVTTPLSIVEWLSGFHAEARKTRGCMEGICKEGELVYVPSGWWHLVVNLSPSIAITQNFVPSAHLAKVLSFLKNKPDQVSGFSSSVKNPYETFTTKMKGRYPELLEAGLKETNNKREPRKRKWDQVIKGQARNGEIMAGFSFDFSEDVR